MKVRLYPRTLVVATASAFIALVVAIACSDSTASPRTIAGQTTAMGLGSAVSYVTLLGDVPVEVGVKFNGAALNDLPPTMPFTEFLLSLPAEASVTPFDHASIN